MHSLIAITGVTEVKEKNAKGLVCLVQTPRGLEQAVVSCNERCFDAASAVFAHAKKSIADHQKVVKGNTTRVRFLH